MRKSWGPPRFSKPRPRTSVPPRRNFPQRCAEQEQRARRSRLCRAEGSGARTRKAVLLRVHGDGRRAHLFYVSSGAARRGIARICGRAQPTTNFVLTEVEKGKSETARHTAAREWRGRTARRGWELRPSGEEARRRPRRSGRSLPRRPPPGRFSLLQKSPRAAGAECLWLSVHAHLGGARRSSGPVESFR